MVVMRENAQTSGESMKQWINTRVEAKYQRVSDVMLPEDFPRNVADEVLKHKLKEFYRGN